MKHFDSTFRLLVPAALGLLIMQGCSQVRTPGNPSASAPTLANGEQAHIRGVSDPNAPFTLIDRTKSPAQPVSTQDASLFPVCDGSSLQVYEAAASMNGAARILRLAFKNRGQAACRLNASPSIALLNQNGTPIASISIKQTGESSLSGVVTSSLQAATATSSSVGDNLNVVLTPSSEASLEIGWSSGDGCPVVSRFAIGIPAVNAADSNLPIIFTIEHPVTVCGGEVRVTSLLAGNSV